MKKYFLRNTIQIALLFISSNVFAFSDVGTHPEITRQASENSILKTYLNDYFGFKKGLSEIITSGGAIFG